MSDLSFLTQSKLYARFRSTPAQPLIDLAMEYLRDKYTGKLELALDIGCGTGQATFMIQPYFQQVIGADKSFSQINEARELQDQEKGNVRFIVSEAEDIQCVTPGSVQLITVCQAIHWFDIPKFFEECKRVLCDDGVLAVIGYNIPNLTRENDSSKDSQLTDLLHKIHSIWEEYWPPETDSIKFGYDDLDIPFRDALRPKKEFITKRQMSLADYANLFRTFSPYLHITELLGLSAAEKIIEDFIEGVRDILGEQVAGIENLDDIILVEENRFYVLLSRK